MASAIREGTFSSSAISSRNIDIVKEKINLKIADDFRTAFYQVEYFIRADTNGRQIPLLFHAQDYKGDFKVWVDNQEVKLLTIPSEYEITANSHFEKFSSYFSQPSEEGKPETVVIYWQKNQGLVYNLSDLKYFEADLTKGEHLIRVEYTASVWTDVSDWVKEYSFRYSLSPAKYWKSFGSLEISLDASDFKYAIKTNLGNQTKGQLDSIAVWNFSKLPDDFFEISYKPKISAFARTMIAVGPSGLTIIFTLLIFFLHFIAIKKYRHIRPKKKYSWAVIVGSIILPFFVLISYILSFGIIDSMIGKEAGNHHGYTFQVIILYPFLLALYGTIMWMADKRIKGQINKAL